jgi:hypothetical protein
MGHMKRILIVICLLMLSGCAHLEIPTEKTYPFRAEFQGKGVINGMDLNVSGAMYLSSLKSGAVEVYGPGGLAAYLIDVQGDTLVVKDMWGNKMDVISLPLSDMAGLFAGDVPRGAYLYREKTPAGMKVTYHWGRLFLDSGMLPEEIRINSDPPIMVKFAPAGKDVHLTVDHGQDSVFIKLQVRQGGRWLSP